MKVLQKLSKVGKGRGSHYHVLYLNDEGANGPFGLATTSGNHSHEIVWQDAQEPQFDEMGNMIAPAQEAGWLVMPGPDGHTHTIEEYVVKKEESTQTDEEIIKETLSLWRYAREHEVESFEKAKKSECFYEGEQWPDSVKRELQGVNRAALTINKIEPAIDELCGYQMQQRTDIAYAPQEDGDQRVADLLNIVVKHILEKCYYEREESKVFLDMVLTGRGAFNVYVDLAEDLRGDIKVERFPWDEICVGPHEKEDLSDCEYLFKSKMHSKAKINQLWPDKAESLDTKFSLLTNQLPHTTVHYWSPDPYDFNQATPMVVSGEDVLIDIAKKEVRVLECWRKVYSKGTVLVRQDDDFYFNAFGWDKKDIQAVAELDGFVAIERDIARIRITKIAGEVLLSDENPSNLPVDDFFLVLVYGKKRRNKFWGKVEGVKDVQMGINKRYSQCVDIGNKMASYGWFYDSTTFSDNEREKFKRIVNSPGFQLEITDITRPPTKVEGTKFPAELVQLMSLDGEEMNAIMNIKVEQGGANESGNALLTRQKMKLTGNEFLFDNLSFAKKKLGKLLLALIQKYYTPQRIYRLVNSKAQKEPVQMGGQDFSQFTEEEILELLTTTDLSTYDVIVSESSSSPTVRMGTFMLMSELFQKGLPIPPEMMIELAEIPAAQKKKLLEMLANQQAAQASAAEATANAEVDKALVAQGIIPPEVQQRLQPQGAQGDAQQVGQPPIQTDQITPLA